ncbi:uncharacterized protein FA14DRAFT_155357 [Meira miltonrushii]|uniref:Pectate lyase n=1 Tax=Meira miltonrushii TaxID=1280837 RepID=A0A316VF53_9BASI|nr:uncharacterized protein FA14DRAFT_155357 [Meira miltonrushii]PWN35944.1 hypothetical protein FA14DRAFT_155357 [Meira miltonrushii]
MLSFNLKLAVLALIAICTILSAVQADITADPKQKIPKKLGPDEGAILIVGNVQDIAISASNVGANNGTAGSKQANPSSAVCHGVIDDKAGTYQGPCLVEVKDQNQVFHAQCLKGKGSASISFFKEGSGDKTAEVQAVDGMYAGFSSKKPLKQGTSDSKKKGVKVILNCDNDKSLN